ncbi:tetratricopeptide repeat protein [Celerinatantimonas sp. YJH-8]|uniref:tetratricopeptide repeat protein n=1 Tax=Celerinatantimonas sp. YJH-8 TaxID=3228714 RepID=UPI0038C33FD2
MVFSRICQISVLFTCIFLAACSSDRQAGHFVPARSSVSTDTVGDTTPLNAREKEQLMIKAENYPGLIELYKKKIEQRDSSSVRLKLAQTYYRSGDTDSAMFQIQYMKQHEKPNAEVFYLEAQCLHEKNKDTEALKAISSAIMLHSDQAKYYNLQGIVSASLDDFISARRAFNKARSLMYTDTVVLNNLAMIDIYQQRYQDAIDKLMPLYRNGQADSKIRANLLVALAKSHQYFLFKEVYAEGEPGKAKAVYQQLAMMTHKDTE